MSVLLQQTGVAARDVPLGQADGVAFLTSDGDLVANQRYDGLSTFVVLDDELHLVSFLGCGQGACRLAPIVAILEQMPVWTEEAPFQPQTADPAAPRPAAAEALSIAGVPWVTIGFLLSAFSILVAAGGLRSGVGLPSLLVYGAKATPLILDRGETWRLFAANLLHKDPLHLAFNAFALWNVGGALERAVRPADYLALIIFTALGTTLISAIGADSISLGASGIAFGVLGASATFGWRRGVRGSLRSYFGLRIVPWLLALFAAGLGSAGVDNWGHAGGLFTGALVGCFLTPRR